jgi:curli biogenesis system outer membrane secretion channel CsgG
MLRGWFLAGVTKGPVLALLAVLALAGCSGGAGGGWTKAGANEAETAQAYQDCAALTDTAVKTESDIDQDISASRASDLQHSSLLRAQSEQVHDVTGERAGAILDSCMQAKGFTRRGG